MMPRRQARALKIGWRDTRRLRDAAFTTAHHLVFVPGQYDARNNAVKRQWTDQQPEVRLALLAHHFSSEINAHPALSTPELSSQRDRVQPTVAALQSALRAAAILQISDQIGPRPTNDIAAQKAWDRTDTRLDQARHALAVRVEHLRRYRAKLDALAEQQHALHVIETGKSVEGRLLALEERDNAIGSANPDAELADEVQAITDQLSRITAELEHEAIAIASTSLDLNEPQ